MGSRMEQTFLRRKFEALCKFLVKGFRLDHLRPRNADLPSRQLDGRFRKRDCTTPARAPEASTELVYGSLLGPARGPTEYGPRLRI